MEKNNPKAYFNTEYSSRSYIEMPKNGEIQYISTITGVRGNPEYKGNEWVQNSDKKAYPTIKVDKDDIKAKRHYVKTLFKDGREVKIWECGLCGKEFRFQYTLVRHIPTHTDVRNYVCDVCPKAFRQLSTLAQHKATHLNMRPFICGICQKSFNRISTLISHKKIHNDEKRHICPYCNKGFHQKGNLRNHMYTHTNERPYKCDICHKGFNQKSNLVCHKTSTHWSKISYNCDVCNKKFVKQSLYMVHMETTHNIIVKFKRVKDEIKLKDPKCTIVDDSNNVIYHLPISKDSSPEPEKQILFEKSISQLNGKNKENEILLIIKHAPTAAMNHLHELGRTPYVLLYQVGETEPKICMAVIKNEEYALVNPSKKTISNYHIENANKHSHSFPVVSTVMQKFDTNGNPLTMVLPAGLPTQYVDSYEGANGINVYEYYGLGCSSTNVIIKDEESETKIQKTIGKRTAYVYTKTEPGQRQKNENYLESVPEITLQVVRPENQQNMDDMVEIVDSENPIELIYLDNNSEEYPKIQPATIDVWDNNEKSVVTESIPKLNDFVKNFSYTNMDENFIQNVFGSGDINSSTMPIEENIQVQTIEIQTAFETQQTIPNYEKDSLTNIDTNLLTPMEIMKEPYSNYLDFETFNDTFYELDAHLQNNPVHISGTNQNASLCESDLLIKLEPDDLYNLNH